MGRSKNAGKPKAAKSQPSRKPQKQRVLKSSTRPSQSPTIEPPKEPPSWLTLSLEQRTFLTKYRADRKVSSAAEAAYINRNTFYNWLGSSSEFAAAFDELEREILDQAKRAWIGWFHSDWKAAAEYLKKYDRPNENKPDKQVIVVEADELPERLRGG